MVNLKEGHAAVDTMNASVDSLEGHSELKVTAFCFFYRHAFIHPAVGIVVVILQLYAILYLCLGEPAPCLQPQEEANIYFACHNSS